MSKYGEFTSRCFSVSLSVSDIKSQLENTETALEAAWKQTAKDLKRVELLESQLGAMFKFIRTRLKLKTETDDKDTDDNT